jgi:membrane protease YdiL (CAAX protease family)
MDEAEIQHAQAARADLGSPYGVIARAILAFFLVQFLSYVGALLIYSSWASAHGHNYTYEQVVHNLNWLLGNSVQVGFLSILASEGSLVLFVWWFLRRRKLGFRDIGLGRRPLWLDLKQAVVGAGAYYILFIIIGTVIVTLLPSVNTNQEQDIGFTNPAGVGLIVAFISLVIIPPLAEEILMRGYLYTGLRRHWGFVPSAIVTSILFGAAHLLTGVGPGLLWIAGIQTFILSVVLVYLREKTGALYAGIVIHALNNFIAFSVHFHASMF